MDLTELHNRFSYHPPQDEETKDAHEGIREWCTDTSTFLNEMLPEGREKSLAMTHLEEVMFWSNAAIARNGGRKQD